MVEDRPEEIEPSPDPGRAKRPPPTIDLQATEVSSETHAAGTGAGVEPELPPPPPPPRSSASVIPAGIIGALSGASTAALVLALAWWLGWPGQPEPPAAPPANSAAVEDLAARVAGLETKTSKPTAAVADPAPSGRVDALEKSLTALRGEVANSRGQSDKLAAAINEVKAAPRETAAGAAAAPDLGPINDRIAAIESAVRAQKSAIAQDNAKPADDVPLRRIVAAALLDIQVRVGEPYPAELAAAKSLAPHPEALKPLEGFAESGVPRPAVLSRELLTLVAKLSPAVEAVSTTGSGLVERLKDGASKLVRIERTDTNGSDPGNIIARVTAAALRNDTNEARRELNTLPATDRAAAQGWLDKADARDAALAASRQFAREAMTALAKPAP